MAVQDATGDAELGTGRAHRHTSDPTRAGSFTLRLRAAAEYGDRAMTRILLVRHGESIWNADGRWQGQADPELSDRGRRQAAEAASALGALDAIVTSDLIRAADTASIVARELGVEEVAVEPGLRERDAGPLSGLDRAQIHQQFPGLLVDDPAGYVPGDDGKPRWPKGFESDDHLWARVEVALLALGRLVPDGDVVAVTHSGVMYSVERRLGAKGRPRLANLDGSWITVERDRLAIGERISLIESAPEVSEPDRI